MENISRIYICQDNENKKNTVGVNKKKAFTENFLFP